MNRVKHREIKATAGHSLAELICILALTSSVTFLSLSGLNWGVAGQNTGKAALLIEQEILANHQLAILNQQTIALQLAGDSLLWTTNGGSTNLRKLRESIPLPRGVKIVDVNFGIFRDTINFYPTGTVSPGRLSISDKKGNYCTLIVSLRGLITSSCHFNGDSN